MTYGAFALNMAEMAYLHNEDEQNEERYEHLRKAYLTHSGKNYKEYMKGRDTYNDKMGHMGGHWFDVQHFFNHLPMETKRSIKKFMVQIPEIAAMMYNGKLNIDADSNTIYSVLNKYPQQFNKITGIDAADIEFIGWGDDVVDNIRYIINNF